jgi:hypothetical protein
MGAFSLAIGGHADSESPMQLGSTNGGSSPSTADFNPAHPASGTITRAPPTTVYIMMRFSIAAYDRAQSFASTTDIAQTFRTKPANASTQLRGGGKRHNFRDEAATMVSDSLPTARFSLTHCQWYLLL